MAALRTRFDYAFESSRATGAFYSALMDDREIEPGRAFTAAGFECVALWQDHGTMPTVGYRIGPIGYSPDAVGINEAGFAILDGVQLWIVDCLRYEPHPTHAHFEKTLGWIERVKPDRAVLTHLNHTLDYNDLAARCPEGVEPGYDGMVLPVPDHAPKAES
jgi:phosphoribosyl 1,2-cyclic phosphate phosphodiesterase